MSEWIYLAAPLTRKITRFIIFGYSFLYQIWQFCDMTNLFVDKNDRSFYFLNFTFLKTLKINSSVFNVLTLLYNSFGTEFKY